jgi:ethanolamine ammonia-lyase small subunit
MLIEDPWTHLRDLTKARIALGRAGYSLPTRECLEFQLAHALARDAVRRPLDVRRFDCLNPVILQSAAPDRVAYLRRPDLGRTLAPGSAALLAHTGSDAAIVIADGLSAASVEQSAISVIQAIKSELPDWTFAPICVVRQGRVPIADEIGQKLVARIAVILIGERPGLTSSESMGIYLTWGPSVGRTDAERNCISNIHDGGLSTDIAARRAVQLMQAARERRLTGVGLRLLAAG